MKEINNRAEVLGYIRELKRDVLPYLHKDYIETKNDFTHVLANPDQFDSDFRPTMISMYRNKYKDKKFIYTFTVELYHSLREHLKTI